MLAWEQLCSQDHSLGEQAGNASPWELKRPAMHQDSSRHTLEQALPWTQLALLTSVMSEDEVASCHIQGGCRCVRICANDRC